MVGRDRIILELVLIVFVKDGEFETEGLLAAVFALDLFKEVNEDELITAAAAASPTPKSFLLFC